MRKIILVLILMCGATLLTAAQEDTPKIPAEVAPFVEKNTKAMALESADLNGDGTPDFILILEKLKDASEDEQGQRVLLIITRGAGRKLTLAARNDNGLVYCRTCGGIFGDPFASLEVGLKTFTVNHYGGSAWRWTANYKFNYSRIDKTWQLVRTEEESFHTSEPDKVKTIINTPPKDFGKISIDDFNPDSFLKKKMKSAAKK